MGKTKKILSIFVILISLFTFNIDKVNAATGTITITSNKSQIVVGNTVIFTVTVTSPKEMVALQYDISYDKTIMTLTSGNTSDAPVFSGNGVKTQKYTFKFKAKKSGTATLKFNAVGATMVGSEEVKFSSKSKSIKVITQAQLEASYSKNNNLSSLGVTGYTLSPKFSPSVTNYTVNLPANTEKITITGKKADSSASIEGLGTKTVVDGTNTIKIKVTAENGSTKTYTINAIVEELNPITITIDDQEYTVIRKAKLLETPNSSFIESTTTINDESVPSLFNEKANMTLVGLKDIEGNIELYIYNNEENTYTKYNQYVLSGLTLYIEDKEIVGDFYPTEIVLNENNIKAYTKALDITYKYFYAINLENGIESIYRYEKDENTVQIYVEDQQETEPKPVPITEDNNEELYKLIIIGLLGFIFLTYIIILFNLIFNKKEKKKKQIQENKEETIIEEKEIVTEEEKEKLIKETEEEIKRIKEENETEEEITIEDIKPKKKTKKKNKKDK